MRWDYCAGALIEVFLAWYEIPHWPLVMLFAFLTATWLVIGLRKAKHA